MQDWKYFDFEDIEGTRQIVRPWLLSENYEFIKTATELVERLNLLFTGATADHEKIDKTIKQIEMLVV